MNEKRKDEGYKLKSTQKVDIKNEDPVKTSLEEDGLRSIAKGIIRFSIKADDTLENLQVHSAFKNFCRAETDNNYTQGLRKLLEYYQSDYKIEMIYNILDNQSTVLEDLRGSIVDLTTVKKEDKPKDSEDEDNGAF